MRRRLSLMTIYDYHLVMKRVRIAELKARLSEYLRGVRRGETVTVMDRDTPVAVITPFDQGPGGLLIRRPPPQSLKPGEVQLPPTLSLELDVVELLLEDRRSER